MAQLSYSSSREIREDPINTMQGLVDDLVAVEQATVPVSVDLAQVRPLGVGWLVSVSLSGQASLDQLVTLQDEIAQQAVDLGLEPDVQTAKENITISSG